MKCSNGGKWHFSDNQNKGQRTYTECGCKDKKQCSSWAGWLSEVFMILQQVGGPPFFNTKTQVHTPTRPVWAPSSVIYACVPPVVPSSQRMRCAQCWMLDCTIPPVSTGEAVIWSCLEEPSCSLWRGRGHCSCALTLLFTTPLSLSTPPPPFLPSVTLFLPHLFTPCSVEAGYGGAQASGIVASHCSTHPTEPLLSRCDTAELFPPLTRRHTLTLSLSLCVFLMHLPGGYTACTPVRWRARACSHQRRCRIYLRVHCPPHTVTAISPPCAHIWTSPIVTEEERGKHTGLQGWGSTAL